MRAFQTYFKNFILNYYIDILLILLIPLISIRGFLFGKGYYFYADQSWPLSNYGNFSGIFSLNSLNGFGFTRIIVTFPYFIIKLLTSSLLLTERLFLYYTFVLYVALAYFFASIVVHKIDKNINKYTSKMIKFIIVLFIFSNLTALNLNTTGGTYADGLIIMFIAISAFAFIAWKNMKAAFMISTILLTISILLDPDYATFLIVAIVIGSILSGILNRDLIYRFKYALLTTISAILPVSFVIISLILTSSSTSNIITLGAVRSYNYGTISFFSRNIKPLYPLILVGHLWSTIVYAPPNILFYGNKISYVKSLMSPAQLLLPNGFITYLWLFTLIMIPFISLTSLIFKETRKITFPVIILFLTFYIMSLVYYIKPLFYLELYISKIPIIGSSIGTTLALPGHIINVMASMYYILFSIALINLINVKINVKINSDKDKFHINIEILKNYIENIQNTKYLKSNKLKLFIVVFIIFIVLFSGWQAFDGSFYPARAPDTFIGNQVANTGGFSPVCVNESVIKAYNIIASQNSPFNILWIGGPAYSNDGYCSAHPTASIPNLNYIILNNMTTDFYYNLLYSNVKYVAISNQDIQKNVPDIYEYTFSNAGFKNFTDAQNFMQNTPGLNEIYSKDQVDIFEIKDFNSIYKSNLLLNYAGNSFYEESLPYLFNTLGYNVAITGNSHYGLPIYFNNNSKEVSVDTPVYLSSLINTTNYKYYNLSSDKNISGSGHGYSTSFPNNFTLTLWSNNETYYNYSNKAINITTKHNSDESVSYNGSFDSGAGGYYVNNNSINLTVTFYAKATNNAAEQIFFMGEPKYNVSTDNIYNRFNFNVTTTYKKYTFSYTFPNTEKYINFRLFDLSDGSFYIKNLSTKYKILPQIKDNATLPFGNYVTLNNTLLKGNNKTALIFMKNDTMNNYKWIKFNFHSGLYIKNDTKVAALILMKNNTLLDNENKSYIVSMDPSSREYELKYDNKLYNSIPGIYGNSIFILNKNVTSLNDLKIITKGKIIMDAFYVGIIIYLSILSYFLFDIYRKNRI